MNLRWIDPKIVRLIEIFSNEIYGNNRRGNKQRLIRDAVLYAESNKSDFKRWINSRNVPISHIINKMFE